MARLPRIVLPGIPHHVTQRGNRRQQVFFEDADYALYLDLIAAAADRAGCTILAYCLMPNHVHFVIVPEDEDGLRATFGEAHRQYTAHINARHRWTGHLWQGRFASVAMDDEHSWAAIRYVALNPVKAGLCARAEDWRWSSAAACLGVAGTPNRVSPNDVVSPVDVAAVIARTGDFRAFLYGSSEDEVAAFAVVERASATGRPVGSREWLTATEARTGKVLTRGKPGPRG
jgi:putative transposase